jgi:hypothetical protein
LKNTILKLTSIVIASSFILTGCFSNEPEAVDFERAFYNMVIPKDVEKSKKFDKVVSIVATVHGQDSIGTKEKPSYSSNVTIKVTSDEVLYELVELDHEGKPIVKKVNNEGASVILTGIAYSSFVNEVWLSDLSNLKPVETKQPKGYSLSHWDSPTIQE